MVTQMENGSKEKFDKFPKEPAILWQSFVDRIPRNRYNPAFGQKENDFGAG